MFNKAMLLTGIAAGLLLANTAKASLLIEIEGVSGSGVTTWTFSGSDTARNGGDFSANTVFGVDEQWVDIGNFTDLSLFGVPEDGGSIQGLATLTIGADSRSIDSVFVDDDAASDDLAIGVDGIADFIFAAGDTVSWAGSLTVTGIDLLSLDETPLPGFFVSSAFGGVPDTLDLEVAIREAAVVPLPASLTMLLGALGLCGIAARRKRVAA